MKTLVEILGILHCALANAKKCEKIYIGLIVDRIDYATNFKLTKAMASTVNIVDVHATADDGAVGTELLFPLRLLHPSPSQTKQWLGFKHLLVSDKQPRSIDLSVNEK